MTDLGLLLIKATLALQNDRSQNYLIFQPTHNTFTKPTSDTEIIIAWNQTIKQSWYQMKSIRLPT